MGRRATMLNLCYQLSCRGIGKPRAQESWDWRNFSRNKGALDPFRRIILIG